jgi:uncharacterized membrane protein YeaQ/YmgE (transglycosylase-associated protein family)
VVVLALLGVLLAVVVVFSLIGLALWAIVSVGIVGIIIGGIARLILPGTHNVGILATVLLGWLGSIIGGFIGYRLLDTNRWVTILLEIVVAAGLIAIYSQSQRKRLTSGRSAGRPW